MTKEWADYVSFLEMRFQLFTSEGSRNFQTVRDHRGKVFLDLGFHDIPDTAASAQ